MLEKLLCALLQKLVLNLTLSGTSLKPKFEEEELSPGVADIPRNLVWIVCGHKNSETLHMISPIHFPIVEICRSIIRPIIYVFSA